MKHAMSAAVALALGIGLAVAAQAHGTYDRQSAIPGTDMQAGTSAPVRHVAASRQMQSRQQIVRTQRMLRAQGFYNGRITGIMDRRTRTALARFEQQKGTHRVAQLRDTHKVAKLHKARQPAAAVGVGSSTPSNGNAMSGSSSNTSSTPIMPPASPAPNAGGNTGTTDQNMNR